MTLPVLIGCERSGVMRNAFLALGYDAWSCDTESADDASNRHIRADVRQVLHWQRWGLLVIMHPPCTRLCNSGAKHLYLGCRKENGPNPAKWAEMREAAAFYRYCRDEGDIACRAIENPVMHGHAIQETRRGITQFVHPYFFGDPFFKNTGFELVNLPALVPTNMLTPPAPGTPEHRAWSACHRSPPGPDRARKRAQTYPGIAAAAADQWGTAALHFNERKDVA